MGGIFIDDILVFDQRYKQGLCKKIFPGALCRTNVKQIAGLAVYESSVTDKEGNERRLCSSCVCLSICMACQLQFGILSPI